MSTKPKKIKELKQQIEKEEVEEKPKKTLDLASASGIFFILLYIFGVYTNLGTGNYLMAVVWCILIFINLFFIVRNRRKK
ncbi:hypothetical protein BN1356_00981 [Streptococcus varani]|uniref:Uncharacterized protein n=1 Tax=Streptococcus varani TaxID=1608583 RepID=A0A0E4H4H3_9STRE|nr:hypothetical protein [Streptococcus varani]CQR24637.1 hypothetical protein BN1356_00981 [Streptococcus varani]